MPPETRAERGWLLAHGDAACLPDTFESPNEVLVDRRATTTRVSAP
jgi:hypothetical protein